MCCGMAFGVFIYRSDSEYDNVPDERYQFPRKYLKRVQRCKGDWILYYEPKSVKDTRGYFAIAKVQAIIPDENKDKMHWAIMEPGSYSDFSDPVPFADADGFLAEQEGLFNEEGKRSGRVQQAVRDLSRSDFDRILKLGHGSRILPRVGGDDGIQDDPVPDLPLETRIIELTKRKVRDQNFRKSVLRAYGKRCAITGIGILNGGGRAEVEAAHIKPVKDNGPDIVNNGIPLSGTAHWMFDRGLVGLDKDLTILVSRQVNDRDTVKSMINETGTLLHPQHKRDLPRPEFVEWHRTHCFKQ